MEKYACIRSNKQVCFENLESGASYLHILAHRLVADFAIIAICASEPVWAEPLPKKVHEENLGKGHLLRGLVQHKIRDKYYGWVMMRRFVLQFLSRPFVVGDRIDIMSGSGAKFATGFVERVDPIYTILRTDTGLPVTIPNKVAMVFRHAPSRELGTFGE